MDLYNSNPNPTPMETDPITLQESINTPLPADTCCRKDTSHNPDALENEVRCIIGKRRKHNASANAKAQANDSVSCNSLTREPQQSKKQFFDPLSELHPDPRLLNKYNLDSRAPYIIHMENLINLNSHTSSSSPSSQSSTRSKDRKADGGEDNVKDKDKDKEKDNEHGKNKIQRLVSGTYSTLAFGKRILKHIVEFKNAFDLKTIGKNKFSVCFSDGTSANKFADAFNKNLSQAFPGEIWIAFVPNFKVIRQYIIRGVDDDDSPEELLANIRPPPDWEMTWSHPFEITRPKRSIRTRNKDDTFTTKFIDTDSYVLRFRSTLALPSIIYMGKRFALIPYVQKVIRCRKCQRYGHLTKICRTPDSKAMCSRCGELTSTHKDGKCQVDSPSCINCKRNNLEDTEHEASANICPVFLKHRHIKKTMAYYNISHAEAEALIDENPSAITLKWQRPPRGVPLPTLREFLPHNHIPNKQSYHKTYAESVSPPSSNNSTQSPSSFTLSSASPLHSPPVNSHSPNFTRYRTTLYLSPPSTSSTTSFPPFPHTLNNFSPSASSSSTPSAYQKPLKSIYKHQNNRRKKRTYISTPH